MKVRTGVFRQTAGKDDTTFIRSIKDPEDAVWGYAAQWRDNNPNGEFSIKKIVQNGVTKFELRRTLGTTEFAPIYFFLQDIPI